MKHHAIIVTGFNQRNVTRAREEAMRLFNRTAIEVTRLGTRGAHKVCSFMISPDGLGARDDRDLASNNDLRTTYLRWLENNRGLFDFAVVEFSAAPRVSGLPLKLQPSEALRQVNRDNLEILAETINVLMDANPPLNPDHDFDTNLHEEFDLDALDIQDILNEIEQRLPLKMPRDKPFTTLRDLLHLVNIGFARLPRDPEARRQRQVLRDRRKSQAGRRKRR